MPICILLFEDMSEFNIYRNRELENSLFDNKKVTDCKAEFYEYFGT